MIPVFEVFFYSDRRTVRVVRFSAINLFKLFLTENGSIVAEMRIFLDHSVFITLLHLALKTRADLLLPQKIISGFYFLITCQSFVVFQYTSTKGTSYSLYQPNPNCQMICDVCIMQLICSPCKRLGMSVYNNRVKHHCLSSGFPHLLTTVSPTGVSHDGFAAGGRCSLYLHYI